MKKHSETRITFRFNILKTAIFMAFFLFVLAGSNEMRAQQPVLASGIVVDESDAPIIGASIVEKGTSNGITTNADGYFQINVRPNAILTVSYLGYLNLEVKSGTNLRIVLVEDEKLLEEVVVIGYGVQKKKLVTGATVQVKGEDIARLNTPSVLGALQSQAPGVNITQISGFIGDGYKVNIRGLGTTGSSSPLYVIDGVPGGSIDGLSPNDIESIDILKDAASAAIYGARGANGVILVTTKRGKEGKVEVSYDGYYGIQNLYKIPTILNAQEFVAVQNEARLMDGLSTYNWQNLLPDADWKAIQDGTWKGTNWLKEVLNKNAPVQSHGVSFTSGTSKSISSIGLNFLQQDATMGVPSAIPQLNRFNARINTESTLFKKGDWDILKIGETLNYRFNKSKGSVARDGIYWNTVHNTLIMSPLMHAYNANGDYFLYADQQADPADPYNWDTANNANKNPIAYMDYQMNQNLSKTHSLQGSLYAELKPLKKLTLRTQFGYLMNASSYRSYTPAYGNLTATLGRQKDLVSQSMAVSNWWSWENTANYVLQTGDHNIDILAGQSVARQELSESLAASAEDSQFYDFEHAFLNNVPQRTTTIQSLTGSPTIQSGRASFFGRVNYNYNETYMASVILRADGSSQFAPGHRWGYFPSVSAGWVISNEDFWAKTLKPINFFKLRASFGQNGNDGVSGFQYVGQISTSATYGGYPFGNSMGDAATGSYVSRGVNPDLKWETQQMFDLGFDSRLLNNRLAFEFDWYRRHTYDWLVTPPNQGDLGVSPAAINYGGVLNTGYEVVLRWNDNIGKDIYYGANLSLGHNKNEVLEIGNSEGILHGPISVLWEGSDECFRTEVGRPVGYFYGFKSAGIFQNQAQIDSYDGPLLLGANTQPGDVIWVDVNNDGKIDADDRTEIGNPHPDFTLGFSLNFDYKGISLDITNYGAFGQQIMKCYRDYVASPQSNFTTDIFQRWHGEGTSDRYPRLSSSVSSNWNRISDIYVENGDYLKIKNITLGYDFKRLLPKLPVQQLKVYVTAQNLFTFTDYSGMDPEIGFSAEGGYTWSQGVDLGFYPSARVYMIGTNIKF